jgi:integrase
MFSLWIIEHGKDLRSGKDIRWQIDLIVALMGANTQVAKIGNAAVHDFVMRARDAGKSDVVINRCLTRLRATLRYAGRKWEVETQAERIDWPSHRTPEPDEKEMYLSPAEARAIVAELPPHIGLAFAFSYYTGCRLNEMATLTWERVDMGKRVAVVETKGTGKAPKFRALRLSDKAMKILGAVERGEDHTPVFDLTNRRKHWEAAREAIRRPDITWHGIRHTTATEAGRRAKSDKMIGKLLGHTPGSRATQRYLHVMDDQIFEALEALPDIGATRKGEGK